MSIKEKSEKLSGLLPHVVKRNTIPLWKSMLIRAITIVGALLFCSLLSMLLMKANPLEFVATMFDGSFGSTRRLWKFAKGTAVLLCIALAVTPAFRMKFWNIGAEGQTLIGALAAVGVAHYSGTAIPNWLVLVLMFLAAVLAGAIWGAIPAIFKALWNTNETLFTLMMNYIASSLVMFFLTIWIPSGSTTLPIPPLGKLPVVINDYFLLIIAVFVLTILSYIYLRYTKHGYEISVVGESENTAKYIGINVKKVIIRTMIISGAICGIAGFLIVAALDHQVTETTVGGMGFTAIMVSWLAKFNPLIMIGTSGFVTFLQEGAGHIVTTFDVNSSFPSMIVGIFLFFIIGCEFFINYRIKFDNKKSTKKKGEQK